MYTPSDRIYDRIGFDSGFSCAQGGDSESKYDKIPFVLVFVLLSLADALKSKTAEAYLGVQGNIGSRKRAINASGSIDQLDGAYLDSTSIVILQTLVN